MFKFQALINITSIIKTADTVAGKLDQTKLSGADNLLKKHLQPVKNNPRNFLTSGNFFLTFHQSAMRFKMKTKMA